jgi:hypothetical protein
MILYVFKKAWLPVEKTSDLSAWHLSQSNSINNLKKA